MSYLSDLSLGFSDALQLTGIPSLSWSVLILGVPQPFPVFLLGLGTQGQDLRQSTRKTIAWLDGTESKTMVYQFTTNEYAAY